MPEDEGQTEGRFNIAVAHLLSINKILEDLKDISLRTSKQESSTDYLSEGLGQKLKLKLVRSLYVQVSSLIAKSPNSKKIWDRIKKVKIKLKDAREKYITNKNHKNSNWIPDYDFSIEDELDDIIILIQIELQKLKYLVPSRDESSLF